MATDIDTIRRWDAGIKLYNQGKYGEAVVKFEEIQEPSSKIMFNIGCALQHAGQTVRASQAFMQCVQKDKYLAIGYFQCALCYHLSQQYSDAALFWKTALEKLNKCKVINYGPVRLQHQLYECEIRHNLALTLLYLGEHVEAQRVMRDAIDVKVTPKHDMILKEAAIACKTGSAFPLVEIPKNAIFRPDPALVANLSKKNYLGKAKVVASIDQQTKSGFSGKMLVDKNDGKIPEIVIEKKKTPLHRSMENLLNVDEGYMVNKVFSKSDESILQDKKGSSHCVGLDNERIEFLKQNVPTKVPPRAPPARVPPQLDMKPKNAVKVPTLLAPSVVGRHNALRVTHSKKTDYNQEQNVDCRDELSNVLLRRRQWETLENN